MQSLTWSSLCFTVGAGKGPVMSPGIHPHSAGLNRISPAVSYLNRDAEGKGEALTFQTNDFGIHQTRTLESWQPLALCSNTAALFPRCSSSLNSSLPAVLQKEPERLRGAATPRAPWLPALLVFPFQNLKNRRGIHRAPSPSRLPEDS